ncbi:MAG: DUF3990 domain-containing protein [Fimbriimonadaceae bacterium]|nr:DUF3990 domain-containing protein [Fimbriimonadaceae bacterium]
MGDAIGVVELSANEPTRPPVPNWLLYHGTTRSCADSVVAGIDLEVGRDSLDFGRGFYTTTNLRQAWHWARRAAFEEGAKSPPAVVWFEVARDAAALLQVMFFLLHAGPAAADYWRLVAHCRDGGSHRPGSDEPWYDLIGGPVSRDWRRRQAFAGFDQVSIHTAAAARLLDTAPKGILCRQPLRTTDD